jgi:four helix bundle protein
MYGVLVNEAAPVVVRSHRDMPVWQDAVAYAVDVYVATEEMPKSELYGLTGQLRRAAVSVAANIAEGSGRKSTPDLLHFLTMASSSLREVDTLLEIIGRLNYRVDCVSLMRRADSIGRQLTALRRTLKERQSSK